ncbi:MAG: sugar ABC transporter ATP-binding protein [Planctomycetes bacterium]|nr:sugar ABC transporter ATP-binding protein [Planctomycetota bacterium]
MDHIIELRGIIKQYPGVTALNDVSIAFRKGEVHALCGENGAGKSTLIKICSGAIVPSAGDIVYEGKTYSHFTPASSKDSGISVIYQEFNLVNELSVVDNIFLGNYISRYGVTDHKAMRKRAREIFSQLGIHIDPDTLVQDLSVGYKQFVEIAKAVSKETKILIMDEPSAPLTNREVDILMDIVKRLKATGVTIIYISHRLEEVFSIADRISVLRDGQHVKTMDCQGATREELVRLMVGRELKETFPERAAIGDDSETLLELRNITGNGVEDISFSLRRGEILGFGGIVGAGRTELAQIICGLVQPTAGTMLYKGKPYRPGSPGKAMKAGIAIAPEDRKQHGLVLGLTIRENINLSSYKKISSRNVISGKLEKNVAERLKKDLAIKAVDIDQTVLSLSGGNQQKVVLARLLASDAELIIFDEPTRGIDVGAKQEVYFLMDRLIREGKTIIMISSEMPELMGMSDRILVLSEGRLTGMLRRGEYSQDKILSFASMTTKKGEAS